MFEITLTIPLSATVPKMPMIINTNSNHPGNFNKTFQTSELELQSLAETKTIPHRRNCEVATSYGQFWPSAMKTVFLLHYSTCDYQVIQFLVIVQSKHFVTVPHIVLMEVLELIILFHSARTPYTLQEGRLI